MTRQTPFQGLKRIWKTLGPGLITGASDDDPSAITTYSQAGAKYGLTTLWTAIIAYPVLAILQEMCARIGIVTQKGLAGVIKTYYPPWILWVLIVLSCPAFLLNIGADIAILGETGNLLFPKIPALYCSIGLSAILYILILLLPYKKLAAVMKLICLSLLVYTIVPFLSLQNPALIFRSTWIPRFQFDKDFVLIIIGITGAIISPYIFFWQASSEAEEMAAGCLRGKRIKQYSFLLMRKDILAGAFFAVLIMYFIILTTGTILHDHGVRNIETVKDAALALRPLAGKLSYILFSIGIIGTGFLIIPVLSTSISYILLESFGGKPGPVKTPKEGRLFYVIIAVAMAFGISMHWMHINSVKALLFTTMLYGITAPFIIGIILHIANNPKIMGEFRNNRISNFVGVITLLLMLCSLTMLLLFF